ncbi:MAG: hypothetical protein RLQ12_07790 [Cyclobacteriaceae bacterium]
MGQDNSKHLDNANEKLVDLMLEGIDHGVESIKGGNGPLIPFSITETNGEKKIIRFVTERLEEGLEKGKESIKNNLESELAVLVYDGYLTTDNIKYDAILVIGFDRTDNVAYLIGQKYKPKKFLSRLKPIGNPLYLGTEVQLLK